MKAVGVSSSQESMTLMRALRASPLALILAAAIVVSWCLAAVSFDQPLLAVQRSRLLLEIGAVNGELFRSQGWWRLIASQFLHVHFPHMLFNALCVLVVGSLIERRHGWLPLAIIYFVGGSIGQVASVVSYPGLVSSGASQALMALCGAAVPMGLTRREKLLVVAILAVQIALDVRVAQTVKAGHVFGFLGGLVVGAALLYYFGRKSPSRSRHAADQPSAGYEDRKAAP